jgi:hypothetical protein
MEARQTGLSDSTTDGRLAVQEKRVSLFPRIK